MADVLEELAVRIGFEVDQEGRRKLEQGNDALATKAVAAGNLIAAGIQKGASLALDAIVGLGKGLAGLVTDFADYGDEVAKSAVKTQTTVEGLQRLRFAAGRSRVDVGSLDAALKKLSTGFVEAGTKGKGPFVEGLRLAGVELRDLTGLDQEGRFKLLAQAISEIEAPAAKAAAAAKLFGKSAGPELLPLLEEGSAGIQALMDRADELGVVLDAEAIAGAEELNDALGDLELQAKTLGAKIGAQLAPFVTDAANRFSEWIAANQDFIAQDLPTYIDATTTAIITAGKWAADTGSEFQNFGQEVGFVADSAGELGSYLADEFAPVIEIVQGAVGLWASAFVGVNTAIKDAIVTVAEYLGVLDTLERAWRALPFVDGGAGLDTLENQIANRIATAKGQAHKRAVAAGDPDALALETQRAILADAQRSAAAGASLQAQQDALAAAQGIITEAEQDATSRAARAMARERDRGAGRGGKGKRGGGGKTRGSKGPGLLESFGSLFAKPEPSTFDRIGSLFGGGDVSLPGFGRGGSPTAGSVFNRIDASFNAPVNVTVELPPGIANGEPAEVARTIGRLTGAEIREHLRQAYDFHLQSVRSL